MTAAESRVEIKHFDGGIVLTIKDAHVSQYSQVEGLKREILPLLEEAKSKRVVLDFTNLKFLATPFFALLIRMRQRTRNIELCNLSPNVKDVLEVTNLNKIFPVCKDPLATSA